MELLWSLGLVVVILLALNHMVGGRASNVLGPVGGIVSGVVSFAVRLCMSALGIVLRLLGGSLGGVLKLPPGIDRARHSDRPGSTPPRWKE